MERGKQIRLEDARSALAATSAEFVELWERGSLKVELFAPGDVDRQTPHDQDELYVVVAGSGTFLVHGERTDFGPGDVLFAAAGVEHRFVEFTPDLTVWVVFYGPEGGEAAPATDPGRLRS